MKPIIYTLSLCACLLGVSQAYAATSTVRYYGAHKGSLAISKSKIKKHDAAVMPAYNKLLKEADKAYKLTCPTVTNKVNTAASGDVHDYYSTAPYLWPDPTKADGLPYVPRDGQINPESRNSKYTDFMRMKRFGEMIDTLALAYYFSDQTKYAEKTADCLRVWYLDEKTRMNPNMDYGQAVPGINTGRGIGIIEGEPLISTADAALLLNTYKGWTNKDQTALNKWHTKYLNWLLTSDKGKSESIMKQNHGSMFDLQIVRLALVLGKNDVAKSMLEKVKTNRIALQIEPDGAQPMELRRTKAFNYSLFNLESLTELADLGTWINVDLWHYQTNDGRGILKAIEFMRPYVEAPSNGVPPAVWHYEQIHPINQERSAPVFRRAANITHNKHYEEIAGRFKSMTANRIQLLQPSLLK